MTWTVQEDGEKRSLIPISPPYHLHEIRPVTRALASYPRLSFIQVRRKDVMLLSRHSILPQERTLRRGIDAVHFTGGLRSI
jgi:hypothetical protein